MRDILFVQKQSSGRDDSTVAFQLKRSLAASGRTKEWRAEHRHRTRKSRSHDIAAGNRRRLDGVDGAERGSVIIRLLGGAIKVAGDCRKGEHRRVLSYRDSERISLWSGHGSAAGSGECTAYP